MKSRRTSMFLAAIATVGLVATPMAAHAEEEPAVIAHRGSSGMAPENTVASTELAIQQRSDFVEIDVQRTKDGKLVNFHDCTMDRTTNVEEVFPNQKRYRVSDFTYKQLQRLDAGSWFHEQYAGEPLQTVDDVIERVDGRTGLLAEINPCEHYDGLATDLAKRLQANPDFVDSALANDRLAVQSFEEDDATEFHELMPEVPVGFLDSERPTDAELVALSKWADQVNPQHTVVDQKLVNRVHELGMSINVWTIDEPAAIREMRGLGVDGIITDYPQTLTQP